MDMDKEILVLTQRISFISEKKYPMLTEYALIMCLHQETIIIVIITFYNYYYTS